jgi:NTE family protein
MEGDLSETQVMRGDPVTLLGALGIFRGLDRETLSAIAAELEWLSLPGGATLFGAGEAPDSMYIVVAGCLGAYSPSQPGQLLSRIPAGETVGEMGLLSGHVRSASVRALRDSDLARLPREAFDRVIAQHPQAVLRLAQLVVGRMESAGQRAPGGGPRTYTLLPQSIEVDVGGFATDLVAALAALGRTELVWSVRGADHTSAWFHRIESANDFVVYVADPEPTTWTKLCVRQADALLMIARADAPAAPWPVMPSDQQIGAAARAELVLLHDERVLEGAAKRWTAIVPGIAHHHVRSADDVARVARLLTGKAIGLVLSGGGARGFAHIGVVRALREAGLPIDLVGGTSMGAIMGAGVAAGWSYEQMLERFHRCFVATNPLSDYTLPVVSLVAGRKVSRLLRAEFGEVAIEDLPLPFYAVSANLTTGKGHVHRDGALWRWLRASVAIPGVLPPVFNQGDVHVDGGAINNLPVDVMRAQNRGTVIGVDVGSDTTFTSDIDDVDLPPLWKMLGWFRRHKKRPTILQILIRAGMVNTEAATAAGRQMTDLLLQPPLASVDLLHWKAFQRAIDAGYLHARERIAALDEDARARLGFPRRQ